MVRGRSGASPAHLDDAIDRLTSSVLFGVLPTRAPRVLVPSRSCQATGLGLITVEDFSLTGQIPMLFRPWVNRRVVDRGGVGPSRTANMGHHTVKTLSWFAALVRFIVACLRTFYVSHL